MLRCRCVEGVQSPGPPDWLGQRLAAAAQAGQRAATAHRQDCRQAAAAAATAAAARQLAAHDRKASEKAAPVRTQKQQQQQGSKLQRRGGSKQSLLQQQQHHHQGSGSVSQASRLPHLGADTPSQQLQSHRQSRRLHRASRRQTSQARRSRRPRLFPLVRRCQQLRRSHMLGSSKQSYQMCPLPWSSAQTARLRPRPRLRPVCSPLP